MDTSKEVLTDNYAFLVEHMKADDVVPNLVSARLVGWQICQEIENRTDAKKVQTLLNEIRRSADPEWFVKFTEALSDTDENHKMIAEKLLAECEKRKQPKPVTTSVNWSRTEPVVSSGSSAVELPLPSSYAPPPAIEANGTTPQHNQPSTHSQDKEQDMSNNTGKSATGLQCARCHFSSSVICLIAILGVAVAVRIIGFSTYIPWAYSIMETTVTAGTEPTRPSSSSNSFFGNTAAAHLPTMEQEWSLQQPTLRTCTHNSTIIKLPPMPVELQVITSVLHNNKVYITGISTDHVPESRRVQMYSLEGNTWSTLPESNYNAPIAIINDHITLIGGRDAKTNALTNVMSSWCEEEGEWRQILPLMPTKRIAGRAYQHGNLVLVTGGAEAVTEREKGNVTDRVHVFNFSTMKWTTPQSLQLPRGLRSHYLIHFDKYIYLMGGALTFLSTFHATPKQCHEEIHNANAWRARWSDIEEAAQQNAGMQDSQQGKSVWTPIVAPPTLRPTVVMFNNVIISVGGISDGLPQDSIYQLVDHDTDSPLWTKVGSMSVGRYRHAVVPLGNLGAALFVAGGFVWVRNDETNLKSASVELVLL